MALSAPAQVRRSARRARLWIFLQVALAMLLATAAVVLVTWLSEQRGFRLRHDLTSGDENTLDPVSIAVIAKLPGDVTIDVFFRPAEFPYTQPTAIAQDRMQKLLRRAKDESAGHIEVEENDLSDPAHLSARTEGRMGDLKLLTVEPGGLFVVSAGTRREIVHVRPEIADIDPGNQDERMGPTMPPRLVNFRGEEALMSALLKVTQGASKKVVFTQGHGEPDLLGIDEVGLSRLRGELESDGFSVDSWDSAKHPTLPADTDVLAIIGPQQVFSAAEDAEIRAFVEGGGQMIASPGERPIEGDHSLVSMLFDFGIKVRARGVVAHPVPSVSGSPQVGTEDCGDLVVDQLGMAVTPITDVLRRAGRRVLLRRAHALERGNVPSGTRVLEILRAPEGCWLELPKAGTDDQFDWIPDDAAERARFAVAMQSSFPLRRAARQRADKDATVRPECRVVVLGATSVFQNWLFDNDKEFVLNAVNWLEGRDYRVRVSRESPQARRVDVNAPGVLSSVHLVAVVLLPLLCVALGLCTAWARRRR